MPTSLSAPPMAHSSAIKSSASVYANVVPSAATNRAFVVESTTNTPSVLPSESHCDGTRSAVTHRSPSMSSVGFEQEPERSSESSVDVVELQAERATQRTNKPPTRNKGSMKEGSADLLDCLTHACLTHGRLTHACLTHGWPSHRCPKERTGT